MIQDMVGPDWLRLLQAAPTIVVYLLGRSAFVLAPLLAVATAAAWLSPRRDGRAGRRVVLTGGLLALTVVTTALAAYHWRTAPVEPAGGFMGSYRAAPREPREEIPSLDPPGGVSWPEETGYLDVPQLAQGGRGVITVSRFGTFPVYVKLCAAEQPTCPGLRHAVLYSGEFAFRDLPSGRYEVRYIPIRRPSFAGKSRPLVIGDDGGAPARVSLTDTPVLNSRRDPVVGLLPEDF